MKQPTEEQRHDDFIKVLNHPEKFLKLAEAVKGMVSGLSLEDQEITLAIVWRDIFWTKAERDGDKLEEGVVPKFARKKNSTRVNLPSVVGRYPLTLKKKTGEVFCMVEPWKLALRDMEYLIAHCKRNSLYFHIDGASPVFPGKHVRLLFSKYTWPKI